MANDYKSQGAATLKEIEKKINATRDAQKKENQTLRDENVAAYTESTNEQIDKTSDAYLDVVRSAGIQKELDLRNIRETRANMGLSRSGLSSTEQTAAILSAGNKVGAAQRSRQQAIDALNKSLLEYTAQEDTKLRTANLSADNTARSNLATATQEINEKVMELEADDYQAGVKAQSDLTIAQINANETAEKDRVSGLNSAWKDGKFGTYNNEVYVIANNAGWSVAEAIRYAPYIESIKNNGGVEKYFTNSRGERNKYIDKTTTGIGDYIAQIPGISYEGIAAMADYFGVDLSS